MTPSSIKFWTQGTLWLCFHTCVCADMCERERGSHHSGACFLNHGLCTANTYKLHHCHATLIPSRLELMVKLRTLLTVVIFTLKAEAHDYCNYCTFPMRAYNVRPITMHWVSWQFRADFACWKEGLCRKLLV